MQERDHALDERAGSVFQPDTMLASQYFDRIRRSRELDPEQRLMFAVLEDAVNVCLKHSGTTDPARRALLLEAEEWIADREASWLYSFENICSVLDLNSDYIRRGLRARKEGSAAAPAAESPAAAAAPDDGPETVRRASGG
jgi:hypothetical protein